MKSNQILQALMGLATITAAQQATVQYYVAGMVPGATCQLYPAGYQAEIVLGPNDCSSANIPTASQVAVNINFSAYAISSNCYGEF
jgi:hypothetical protein